MTLLAAALVLSSAALHAVWNTIAKRAYQMVKKDNDFSWLPDNIEKNEIDEFKGPF